MTSPAHYADLTKGAQVIVTTPEFPGERGVITRTVERWHGANAVHVALPSRPDHPEGLPFSAAVVRLA